MSSNTSSNQNKQNTNIFEQYEQAKKESGRYLKLSSGEHRVLQFNINKIAIVDTEFENKPTGGRSVQFTVIDPVNPQQEKLFTIGVKKAEGIMTLLRAGRYLLEISKSGSGRESQYIAIPV